MKRTAVVVLVLFFVVIGSVWYFGLNEKPDQPVVHAPADQSDEAFGLLDSIQEGA